MKTYEVVEVEKGILSYEQGCRYNVQILVDNVYCGDGKFCKSKREVYKFIIQEMKSDRQQKEASLITSLGIFFAFSKEQFNESIVDGVKYVDARCGMFIPVDNVKTYIRESQNISKYFTEQFKKIVPIEDYILCELWNHEAFYTYSMEDTFNAVKNVYPECTIEQVKEVFNEEKMNVD